MHKNSNRIVNTWNGKIGMRKISRPKGSRITFLFMILTNQNHRIVYLIPGSLKVESQNFLDPVLAKPESKYKARFKKYRSGLNIIEH